LVASTCELGILYADATAALPRIERPEATQLFLMDDGVRLAVDARLQKLVDAGLEVTMCATDAEARTIAAPDGVRLGSQHDHALMIRSAGRILALTGAQPSESRPADAPDRSRRVAVRITRMLKAVQALRSAVGYAAAELPVTVVIEPAARGLLAHSDHPPAILRALGTLRGLGHPILEIPAAAEVEIAW
jgi:hypothetical protein